MKIKQGTKFTIFLVIGVTLIWISGAGMFANYIAFKSNFHIDFLFLVILIIGILLILLGISQLLNTNKFLEKKIKTGKHFRIESKREVRNNK